MQISLSVVMVDSQERALEFYTNKLGFKKHRDVFMGPFRWLTVISTDGVNGAELMLEKMEFPPALVYQKARFDAGIPAVAFMTNNIEAEYQQLEKRGVQFLGKPKSMGPIVSAVFEDTCGNLVNLVQAAG